MNDPLAFLRRLMRETEPPKATSADIPTLTRVAEEPSAAEEAPVADTEQPAELVDHLVSEYLPIIEHELRRRLRERLLPQED